MADDNRLTRHPRRRRLALAAALLLLALWSAVAASPAAAQGGTWCYQWDFTAGNGSWTAIPPAAGWSTGGTYSAGTGWTSTVTSISYLASRGIDIYRAVSATVTRVLITYNRTAGSYTSGNLAVYFAYGSNTAAVGNNTTFFSENSPGSTGTGITKEWTGSISAPNIFIDVRTGIDGVAPYTDPGGSATITAIRLEGTGSAPAFGDNCTPTPTPTPTNTDTPTATFTPSDTPAPTDTPTSTPTPSPTRFEFISDDATLIAIGPLATGGFPTPNWTPVIWPTPTIQALGAPYIPPNPPDLTSGDGSSRPLGFQAFTDVRLGAWIRYVAIVIVSFWGWMSVNFPAVIWGLRFMLITMGILLLMFRLLTSRYPDAIGRETRFVDFFGEYRSRRK